MYAEQTEKQDSLRADSAAKNEVVQLVELKTNTLQTQFDQLRSDHNVFKEETDHTLGNVVPDVSKLHRNMAKLDSLAKENKSDIETLRDLYLMPTQEDTKVSDEKESKSPASKTPQQAQHNQPIDQFKRILALININ